MARDERRAIQAEATRIKLLQAGLDLLQEEPTENLFEVTSARRVIAKAKSSSGAYYNYFDGHDSYIDQLLTFSLEATPVPEHAAAAAAFEDALQRGESFDRAIIAGGAEALRFSDVDPTSAVMLLVRAKASRDNDAKERLVRMYELVNEFMAPYYAATVERLGREFRPPYTARDMSTAVLAIAEGLYLRRAVLPADVPDETLGSISLVVFELYTRRVGESGGREERLATSGAGWNSV